LASNLYFSTIRNNSSCGSYGLSTDSPSRIVLPFRFDNSSSIYASLAVSLYASVIHKNHDLTWPFEDSGMKERLTCVYPHLGHSSVE
jgi:hypothetical protein